MSELFLNASLFSVILKISFVHFVGEIRTDAKALNDWVVLVGFKLVQVFNIPLGKDCHMLDHYGHFFVNPNGVKGCGDDLSEIDSPVFRGLVREKSEASPLGGFDDAWGGHRVTVCTRRGVCPEQRNKLIK